MIATRPRGERGRIVIHFGFGPANAAAMQTALSLARAFGADVEGVFIEDRRVAAASALSCARLVSPLGRRSWRVSERDLAAEMRALGAALKRRLEQMAAEAHVPFHQAAERAQGGPAAPPQFVVLGEPLDAQGGEPLRRYLSGEARASGVIVAGPNARASEGPIAAVIEDLASAKGVLQMAQKLAASLESSVIVIPACSDWAGVRALEQALREADIRPPVAFYRDCLERPLDLILALRRTGAGFAVAEFGGKLLPDEAQLFRIVRLIDSPMALLPRAKAA